MKLAKIILLLFFVVLAVAVGLAIAGGIWGKQQLEAVDVTKTQTVLFIIPKGASMTQVAASLADKGLVRNDVVFGLFARWIKLDRELQAGSYDLSPSMSASEIVEVFREGSQELWVTIPEGLRVEEVAARFASDELPNFDEDEFISIAEPSEGMLFPDTYLIPRESSTQQVFDLLTRTFHDKVELKLADELQASELSLEEIVTLASLVQRESRTDSDMRRVAGVIANRLELGMKLDIDATLSYARGFDPSAESWWSAPNPSLKSIDSPYNTYMRAGLPPGPIANPGLEAIEAALDPTPTTALFYLHTPSGQSYYADTYEEHLANIERYLR